MKRKEYCMEVDAIVAELQAIRLDIGKLREDIDRYRGFIGGVAWALSALAGMVGFVWGVIKGAQ